MKDRSRERGFSDGISRGEGINCQLKGVHCEKVREDVIEGPGPEKDLLPGGAGGSAVDKLLELVGEGNTILELGCGRGDLTRLLRERGCQVTELAEDPEQLDLGAVLGEEKFDAIVAADILPFLREPASLLRSLKRHIAPGGCLVASVPNVAHGSVRLALLNGEFPCGDGGLLGSGSVSFFTRKSILQMCRDAGYMIDRLRREEMLISEAPVSGNGNSVALGVMELISRDRDLFTAKFIFSAVPVSSIPPSGEEVPELNGGGESRTEARLRRSLAEQQEHLETLVARNEYLAREKEELKKRFLEAHGQLVLRDEEFKRLLKNLESREEEILLKDRSVEEKAREAAELRAALDGLLYSPMGRLYRFLRKIVTFGRR